MDYYPQAGAYQINEPTAEFSTRLGYTQVIPADYVDESFTEYVVERAYRELGLELAKRLRVNEAFFIQVFTPTIFHMDTTHTYRLQIEAKFSPFYRAWDLLNYTQAKPPKTATTPLDAAADGVADWILRRLLYAKKTERK